MSKLLNFFNKLEKLRKPKSEDPFDNRITHCYLIHEIDGKKHRFEVRGWKPIKEGILDISVVNWTVCAGYAHLELTEELVTNFKIEA